MRKRKDLEIAVWYGLRQRFGHAGRPQRWVNILGRISGSDGVRSLTASLNGGPPQPISVGPDHRRLAARGDFNIELDIRDLQAGANHIEITAESETGQSATEHVELQYAAELCPLPLEIDWKKVNRIDDVAHVVDGQWSLVDGGISPDEIGYDRLVAVGDMIWRDYEVTVPVTVHGISAACYEHPAVHAGAGVVLRWKGHTSWGRDPWCNGQPRFGPSPYGAIGWYCVFHDVGPMLNILDPDLTRAAELPRRLPLHVPHVFKLRAETLPEDASRYSLKVWTQGAAEPADWALQTVIRYADYKTGALLLGAHHMAVTFGNVVVTPIL